MSYRTKLLISDFVQLLFGTIGLVMAVRSMGWKNFMYYTELSNYLLMTGLIIHVIYLLKGGEMPRWVTRLKFAGVCTVTVTFVVVVTVLSWFFGLLHLLTAGVMLYHHTICPLLAVASFLFLEKEEATREDVRWSLLPTLLYGTVMIILNIVGTVVGPYPFLMVRYQPWYMSIIWIIVIVGGAALLSMGLRKLHKGLI